MYYIEINEQVIPEPDVIEWAKWFETNNRRIVRTEFKYCHLSSVFLALDHNYLCMGDPILYETMIFNGLFGDYQTRYSSRQDCILHHHQLAEMLVGVTRLINNGAKWRRIKKVMQQTNMTYVYRYVGQRYCRTWFSRNPNTHIDF